MAQEKTDDTNVVKITRRRHAKCYAGDGGGSQERTFSRRLSPLERQSDGSRHTEASLTAELEREADEWEKSKYWHPRCRDAVIESLLKHIDQLDADHDRLRAIEFALLEHRAEPAVQQLLDHLGFKITEDAIAS